MKILARQTGRRGIKFTQHIFYKQQEQTQGRAQQISQQTTGMLEFYALLNGNNTLKKGKRKSKIKFENKIFYFPLAKAQYEYKQQIQKRKSEKN